MQSDVVKHYPVLLNELISIITPQYGGTFIDCTFGQGGYTKKILSYQNTKVIALDRDAPDLFSSQNETSSAENLLSQDNDDQDDDLEIPAFLRRQKN